MKTKGGGKAKGGNFERFVCKALSLWVTHGKRKDVFWRSAMSGGRATVHGETVRQCGDICSVSREGHPFTDQFIVETKHIKDLQLDRFTILHQGPMVDFWTKLQGQAKQRKLKPMLIAQQNFWPPLVIMNQADIPALWPVECILYNKITRLGVMQLNKMLHETIPPAWDWLKRE